ncbi:hypothetical protein GLOIN_2v1787594 [Rhizophagus irregularis DAOM 181602=DAOM 197198]|uniref:Uncharacterized protein n=1 Tax=Rhizophagus irregularis (strain DAOM 181602 / DAOM 197198 / MUCL 43194) TaxID=747089 RepID=U9T7X5_RHIID|nr:hypothetical protein GLOIN_2v1787594 [Rhizophagus irregularis DAOM 181602=DAOM 197198]
MNISNHSGRDSTIQSIFDAGNEKFEAMAISDMQKLTEEISDADLKADKREVQHNEKVMKLYCLGLPRLQI